MNNLKMVLVVVVVGLVMSGCTSIPGISPGHELIGKTRIHEVKSFVDVALETKDLSVKIVDSKTLIVSGRILNPTLIFNIVRKEERFRANGAWGTNNSWSPTGKRFPGYKKRERWPLLSIKLRWNGKSPSLKIKPDGSFQATIKADTSSYFIKPKWGQYHKGFVTRPSLYASANHVIYDPYTSHYASIDFGKVSVYTIEEDTKAVRAFGENLARNRFKTSPITINFKEQITRRGVSPEIIITPVGIPTKKDFLNSFVSSLEKEFRNNYRFVNLGMKGVKSAIGGYRIFWGGKIKKDRAQAISFDGIVGQRYKIETVHGEYYYFKGFLSPKSSFPISKTVLLVEKGEKIRVQEVREGEGGSMIDQ